MHWIIQNNIFNEDAFASLMEHIERLNVPHTIVKVVPFSDDRPLEERIIPLVNPEGLVMVIGSLALARVARDVGWRPGSFYNENHDYRVWKEHYGQHLLNHEAITCRFDDVEHKWDEFFIRPCLDTKAFAGLCMDWEEFRDWKKRILDLKEYYTTVDEDTPVMYGPIKTIHREARFFVVDGKIVTQSTYKIGSRISYTKEVPPTMLEYAEKMVALWQPARAFVIDIALTDDADDGYNKIVELNCINCSGFYEIDVQRLVIAIEEMKYDD